MHYLLQIDPPRQVLLGHIGDEPIYQDCAGCGAKDAVIHGAIAGEDGKVCILRNEDSVVFQNAYYCAMCFAALARIRE